MQRLADAIRELINEPRKQYQLMQNRIFWNQLCTALDVVEDTDLAIASYGTGQATSTKGGQYLATYGLMQALFLQQDAVTHLQEALGMADGVASPAGLKEIRELRNDIVGHPTKRRGRKGLPDSFHTISRISLGPSGFQMLSYLNGTHQFRDVNGPEIVAIQQRCVEHILAEVQEHLENEMRAHKEKFRMERLADAFPPTLGYYFEKLFEGTNPSGERRMGKVGLDMIKQVLTDLTKALGKRGIALDTYDSIQVAFQLLDYPISRLHPYFDSATAGRCGIDSRDAYIYAYFARDQVRNLRSLIDEIDKSYSSPVP